MAVHGGNNKGRADAQGKKRIVKAVRVPQLRGSKDAGYVYEAVESTLRDIATRTEALQRQTTETGIAGVLATEGERGITAGRLVHIRGDGVAVLAVNTDVDRYATHVVAGVLDGGVVSCYGFGHWPVSCTVGVGGVGCVLWLSNIPGHAQDTDPVGSVVIQRVGERMSVRDPQSGVSYVVVKPEFWPTTSVNGETGDIIITADGLRAFTPTFIAADETFTVPADRQVLYALPIDVEGVLEIDGALVPAGEDGTDGVDGAPGSNGVGVPAGGSTGQSLTKIDGINYNTQWATPVADSLVSGAYSITHNNNDFGIFWNVIGDIRSNANISATTFQGNGQFIEGLDASKITSGLGAQGQVPRVIFGGGGLEWFTPSGLADPASLSAAQTFTGLNTFSSKVTANAGADVTGSVNASLTVKAGNPVNPTGGNLGFGTNGSVNGEYGLFSKDVHSLDTVYGTQGMVVGFGRQNHTHDGSLWLATKGSVTGVPTVGSQETRAYTDESGTHFQNNHAFQKGSVSTAFEFDDVVKATGFVGDGSGLTNLLASAITGLGVDGGSFTDTYAGSAFSFDGGIF